MKLGGELASRDRQVCNGNRLHQPIAAAYDKSTVIPERPTGKDIPASGLGQHGPQFRHGQSAEKGIHATNDPRGNNECGAA